MQTVTRWQRIQWWFTDVILNITEISGARILGVLVMLLLMLVLFVLMQQGD